MLDIINSVKLIRNELKIRIKLVAKILILIKSAIMFFKIIELKKAVSTCQNGF